MIEALGTLFQVVDAITKHIESKNLGLVHDEDMRLYAATTFLIGKDQLALAERKDDLMIGWVEFSRKVADLHAAADAFDQAGSEARLKTVLAAFVAMKPFYREETLSAARSLADRHTCPMHPDVIGNKDDPCPKCGMPLDLPARIVMFRAGAAPSAPHTILAKIRTEGPLTVGTPFSGRLMLTRMDGSPIGLDALREVHTQKIHLLIIDSSLTDYHHEHPVAIEAAGEYRFSFVPRKPGPYRAWADIQPLASGFQEYARAEITAFTAPEPLTDKTLTMTGTLEGLRYDLSFDQPEIHVGQSVKGKLRITKAKRGAAFKKLEPLMGAFAHLVGFNEDGETVLHMHPKGSKVLTAEDRGGPDLEFQLYTTQPGFYRLFAQVQIDGVSKFVPFGLRALP